jgi:hypothetical protein
MHVNSYPPLVILRKSASCARGKVAHRKGPDPEPSAGKSPCVSEAGFASCSGDRPPKGWREWRTLRGGLRAPVGSWRRGSRGWGDRPPGRASDVLETLANGRSTCHHRTPGEGLHWSFALIQTMHGPHPVSFIILIILIIKRGALGLRLSGLSKRCLELETSLLSSRHPPPSEAPQRI